MWCFFKIIVASKWASRQWRALFNHLNCQKCSECGVFCTFWRHNAVHFFNSSTSKSAPSMRSVLHFDFQVSDGSASAALNGPDYVGIPSQTRLSKGAFNIRGMGLIYIYIYYQYIINISYHIISYNIISYHIIPIIICHKSPKTSTHHPELPHSRVSHHSTARGVGALRSHGQFPVWWCAWNNMLLNPYCFFPLGNKSKHETTHPRFTR